MVEESEYCSRVIKNHFNKELVITKEDDRNCWICDKCWICDNCLVGNYV